MSAESAHLPSTKLIDRLVALIAALRDGPLARSELVAKLGSVYPEGDSTRRMIERDIVYLRQLGITIERSGIGPSYHLHGGTPNFSAEQLRTLALIRDNFSARHPNQRQVRDLLDRLTAQLSPSQQREYQRIGARRAMYQPVIDYSDFDEYFRTIEDAINVGQPLRMRYRALSGNELTHIIDPYTIEFYDRHFYLVAYSNLSHRITCARKPCSRR